MVNRLSTIPIDIHIPEEDLRKMVKDGDFILEMCIGDIKYKVDLRSYLKHGDHDQSTHGKPRGGAKPDESEDTGKQKPQSATDEAGASEPKKFNRDEWAKLDPRERNKKWEALPARTRDELANAGKSIQAREKALMDGLPERPKTENLTSDINTRIDHFNDRIHPEAADKIRKVAQDYDNDLKAVGASDEIRRELSMAAVESLATQEMESCTRQLGDHGTAHIEGNIRMASDTLSQVPGANTPMDRAVMRTAMIFHDTGYLAPPSQMFMDEGHPRWSAEHYDANLRSTVAKALGQRNAAEVGHIMRTHDQKDMDWDNDPVASASRLADNLALFHKEKLPPIMRYIPGNTELLKQMAGGKISIDECHTKMKANVDSSDLPDKVKTLLHKGITEVSVDTPKFSLGMLGGEVSSIKWNGEGVDVKLKENKDNTTLNQLGDFGQKQFAKFAKTYDYSPEDFQKNLGFEFRNRDGELVLRGIWEKEKGWTFTIRKESK